MQATASLAPASWPGASSCWGWVIVCHDRMLPWPEARKVPRPRPLGRCSLGIHCKAGHGHCWHSGGYKWQLEITKTERTKLLYAMQLHTPRLSLLLTTLSTLACMLTLLDAAPRLKKPASVARSCRACNCSSCFACCICLFRTSACCKFCSAACCASWRRRAACSQQLRQAVSRRGRHSAVYYSSHQAQKQTNN